jgi:hypothetical protein
MSHRGFRAALRGSIVGFLVVSPWCVGSGTAQVRQALAEAQIDLIAEAPDDNFGWSVAEAGDVNGDGVRDLIVGAIYNDSAAKDAGEAYVYLGGPVVSNVPFVTMTGMAPNDQFGVSVAGAGDVNGDGFADVIVGARLSNLSGNSAGAAFVFFGGPAMDGAPDLILLGEADHDWFGNSVAGAGDVNGDGFADVIVGAPYNDRGGGASGAAYVFFGGASPDNQPDAILVGEMHDDQFGWSVSGAGDADGDGNSDVIVGARLHCVDMALCQGAAYARGRAYLFFGGWPMDSVPDRMLDGSAANDWFGNTVAGVGDLDGDGFDDAAVGAIYADPVVGGLVQSAAGAVTLQFGGGSGSPNRSAFVPGEQRDAQFGWALGAAGDADGDGHEDFWATAHFHDEGTRMGAGKAYLFSGRRTPGPPIASMAGEGENVQLGQSVAGGDVAGGGNLPEGIVGQVYSGDAGPGSGKALMLSPFCVALSLEGGGDFGWTSCQTFPAFQLYRGDVSTDLVSGGTGTCFRSGLGGTTSPPDPEDPTLGSAHFYVLTGREATLEGAKGFDSSGGLRPNPTPCP